MQGKAIAENKLLMMGEIVARNMQSKAIAENELLMMGEIVARNMQSKAIAENKNAIVASCWTYFTTIKHDARNHKY